MKLLQLAVLTVLVANATAARILALLTMPSKSHGILMERLIRELGTKGHQITYISASPPANGPIPNVELIKLEEMHELFLKTMADNENGTMNWFKQSDTSPWLMFLFTTMGRPIVDYTLSHPKVQKLINSDQKFDLILSEVFLNEGAIAGFSHRFQAPIVAVMPFMPNIWGNYLTGNPSTTSYIPDSTLGFSTRMSFSQRLNNFLYVLAWDIVHPLIHLRTQDSVMKHYFGSDAPAVKDIIRNTSLVLVNHHHALGFPRPNLPNVIEVGGMHIYPVKPLPSDLKKEMDSSKNGVVLFSLGSNLKSSEMEPEKINAIIKCFARQPYDFLWKFEAELPNLPKNVKISPWLPQSDILGHPKLKLFITHGGLLSTTEAVTRGVPVLGIPIFGDQPLNMQHTENAGLGKTLKYKEITEELLCNAITELTTNPKYTKAAKLKSQVLQDDMNSPIEKAVWWIEYVVKYQGAAHLRSSAQDLCWYQLHQLDVIILILISLTIVVFIHIKLLKIIIRLCKQINSPGKNIKTKAKKTN